MICYILANIGEYYVLLDDQIEPLEVNPVNSRFFSTDLIEQLADGDQHLFTIEEIESKLGTDLQLDGSHFTFKLLDQCAVLYTMTFLDRLLTLIQPARSEAIFAGASRRAIEFKLLTKSRLVDKLFSSRNRLGNYIDAWAEYLFCDHYSLWIYNRFTEAFTCSAASFPYPRTYIYRSENRSINHALEEGYVSESRLPRPERTNYEQTLDMQTLNRVRLDLGFDGTIGVLSMYSRHPNFRLSEHDVNSVRYSVETKYLQVRQQARQVMNEINQHFIEPYETSNLNQFLHKLTGQVCEKFQCEACSIYLYDAELGELALTATSDRDQRGEPGKEVSIPVNSASSVAQVYTSQSMQFSYDLPAEERHEQEYIEVTEGTLRNRLLFPLHHGSQGQGVLSVLNKHELGESGGREPQNFRTSDFVNLSALCNNLSDLIRIESLFDETQARLAETNASMDEMKDFNKVFLHEIRTPISKFTMAPEIIKRTLMKEQVTSDEMDKVMKQLNDIQVMGDRLEFVAKTFNFNQIVTRRNFATLSVLRDIIFPVLNITRGYLRKQYDIDIQLETTGLQSTRVWGDKTLLNIVFNTLIDNAGKYSINTHKPITVSGGYEADGESFRIDVSNYGLPIHPDEVELLYDKGFRGQNALKHGIGGTGIGLHLASRIMSEGGGNLVLTSLADPVIFTIQIPTKGLDKGNEQYPDH